MTPFDQGVLDAAHRRPISMADEEYLRGYGQTWPERFVMTVICQRFLKERQPGEAFTAWTKREQICQCLHGKCAHDPDCDAADCTCRTYAVLVAPSVGFLDSIIDQLRCPRGHVHGEGAEGATARSGHAKASTGPTWICARRPSDAITETTCAS
jgi:hypothetical protein